MITKDGEPLARRHGRVAGAAAALARTVLLMRDHIRPEMPDQTLVDALLATRVVLVADRANLRTAAAQHALTAAALLAARSGATVSLATDDVALQQSSAPVVGDRLDEATLGALRDLIPGIEPALGWPHERADVAVVLGDTPCRGRAHRMLRLGADAWSGSIETVGTGERFRGSGCPFGALAAAGLAAAEIFKAAMWRCRAAAIDGGVFDSVFAPMRDARILLAPPGTPDPTSDLGAFDLVSGGAITQAALFALTRIPGVHGHARVIEPEHGDLTNLNRYALLLRSRVQQSKADDLAAWASSGGLGGITINPVIARYSLETAGLLEPLAPHVLVGVDDIPARWAVQAARPAWLGIGATTHYAAMASFHTSQTPCAYCLHPRDEPGDAPIPTAAFVSHWAGLWLASLFVRAQSSIQLANCEQVVFHTPLRSDTPVGLRRTPAHGRSECPFGCAAQ